MAITTELQRLLIRIIGDSTEYTKTLKKVVYQTQGAVGDILEAGARMTRAFTIPLSIIGGFSARAFARFDHTLRQSTSIMDATEEQLVRLRDAAIDLSTRAPQSAAELSKAYRYLASAGYDVEQSIRLLPAVQQFATAGMFDLATATTLAADAQSALGLKVKDAEHNYRNFVKITNVLTKADMMANASTEQFSRALTTHAGASLRVFGKDVEEGVAVLAAMADQGTKGQVAGHQLSRIMRLLAQSSQKSAEAHRLLGFEVFETGNKVGETEGKMRSFADIVENLENILGPMGAEARAVTLDMLGFQARIQHAVLPLIGMSAKIREYETSLRNAGRTTEQVVDKQLKSFTNQMLMIRNNLAIVGIEIGSRVTPVILGFAQMFSGLATLWKGFNETVKDIIVNVGLILAVLGPLHLLLAGVAYVLTKVTFGLMAMNTALAVTKVLLVAIGAAAIVSTAVMKKYNESVAEGIKLTEQQADMIGDSTRKIIARSRLLSTAEARETFLTKSLETLKKQMGEYEKHVRDFEERIEKFKVKGPGGFFDLAQLKLEASQYVLKLGMIKASVRDLQEEIKALNDQKLKFDPMTEEIESVNKMRLSIMDLEQDLTKEIETFGKTGTAARIHALALEGATEEQLRYARALMATKEALDLRRDVIELTKDLQIQAATIGMGSEEARIYALALRGASEAELAAARSALDTVHAQQELQDMYEEGEQITKEMRKPTEVYADTIDHLDGLLATGALSQETYRRAVKKAKEDMDKAIDSLNSFKNELRGVTAAGTNTQEAAARLSSWQTVLDEMARNAKEAQEEIRRTKEETGKIKPPSLATGERIGMLTSDVLQILEDASIEAKKYWDIISGQTSVISKSVIGGVTLSKDIDELIAKRITTLKMTSEEFVDAVIEAANKAADAQGLGLLAVERGAIKDRTLASAMRKGRAATKLTPAEALGKTPEEIETIEFYRKQRLKEVEEFAKKDILGRSAQLPGLRGPKVPPQIRESIFELNKALDKGEISIVEYHASLNQLRREWGRLQEQIHAGEEQLQTLTMLYQDGSAVVDKMGISVQKWLKETVAATKVSKDLVQLKSKFLDLGLGPEKFAEELDKLATRYAKLQGATGDYAKLVAATFKSQVVAQLFDQVYKRLESLSPEEKTLKDWEELRHTLRNIAAEVDKIKRATISAPVTFEKTKPLIRTVPPVRIPELDTKGVDLKGRVLPPIEMPRVPDIKTTKPVEEAPKMPKLPPDIGEEPMGSLGGGTRGLMRIAQMAKALPLPKNLDEIDNLVGDLLRIKRELSEGKIGLAGYEALHREFTAEALDRIEEAVVQKQIPAEDLAREITRAIFPVRATRGPTGRLPADSVPKINVNAATAALEYFANQLKRGGRGSEQLEKMMSDLEKVTRMRIIEMRQEGILSQEMYELAYKRLHAAKSGIKFIEKRGSLFDDLKKTLDEIAPSGGSRLPTPVLPEGDEVASGGRGTRGLLRIAEMVKGAPPFQPRPGGPRNIGGVGTEPPPGTRLPGSMTIKPKPGQPLPAQLQPQVPAVKIPKPPVPPPQPKVPNPREVAEAAAREGAKLGLKNPTLPAVGVPPLMFPKVPFGEAPKLPIIPPDIPLRQPGEALPPIDLPSTPPIFLEGAKYASINMKKLNESLLLLDKQFRDGKISIREFNEIHKDLTAVGLLELRRRLEAGSIEDIERYIQEFSKVMFPKTASMEKPRMNLDEVDAAIQDFKRRIDMGEAGASKLEFIVRELTLAAANQLRLQRSEGEISDQTFKALYRRLISPGLPLRTRPSEEDIDVKDIGGFLKRTLDRIMGEKGSMMPRPIPAAERVAMGPTTPIMEAQSHSVEDRSAEIALLKDMKGILDQIRKKPSIEVNYRGLT